jgi:hypothetical protein
MSAVEGPEDQSRKNSPWLPYISGSAQRCSQPEKDINRLRRANLNNICTLSLFGEFFGSAKPEYGTDGQAIACRNLLQITFPIVSSGAV